MDPARLYDKEECRLEREKNGGPLAAGIVCSPVSLRGYTPRTFMHALV